MTHGTIQLALFLLTAAIASAGSFTSSAMCAGISQSVSDYNPTSTSCLSGVASANASASLGSVIANSFTSPTTPASAGATWSGTYWLTITGRTGTGHWTPGVSLFTSADTVESASVSVAFGGFTVTRGNVSGTVYGGGCAWGVVPELCGKAFTFDVPFLIDVDLHAGTSSQFKSTGSLASASVGVFVLNETGLEFPPQTSFTLTDVPEPGTWWLVVVGLACLCTRAI